MPAGFTRNLPHLYLRGGGRPESYTSRLTSRGRALPERDRLAHADLLSAAFAQALRSAEALRQERDPDLLTGVPGFYLDFEIPADGAQAAIDRLEHRPKNIELVALRQEIEAGPALATVFVPDSASSHFRQKIEEYRSQDTTPRRPRDPAAEPMRGRPRNEQLIARIADIRLAALRSIYTDDPVLFPAEGETIWWEVWIRQSHVEAFDSVVTRMELPIGRHRLDFPDREVRLVYSNLAMLGRLYLNSNSIAEIRRAKDTPAPFVSWSNIEQAAWSTDLAQRIVAPEQDNVAICILDTGATQTHPLLTLGLDTYDVHKYDPTWADGDRNGHGTNMAGMVLYGDLAPILESSGPAP